MGQEDILDQVRNRFEKEDEIVFRGGQFSIPESEDKLLDLADKGHFYCQTVLRCEEGHPTIRKAGTPKSISRPNGMPFCTLCEEHVKWGTLQQDVKFILSEETREGWSKNE